MYENWNIKAKHDISLNHIMFGEIGAWLYKGIGGILPDTAHPGFKNILLQPHFVKGLDQFEASHISPQGTIISSWRRKGNMIQYSVTIPPNSTATLQFSVLTTLRVYINGKLVEANTVQLEAGKYQFDWK